jgi:orotate phosphoribosyltransferase
LLVANVLALQWNIPVTDPASLVAGRILGVGGRLSHIDANQFLQRPQKILVVDDSVYGGAAIRQTKAKLEAVASKHDLHFAAVYASSSGRAYVDFTAEIIPHPRVFEWNLFHHSILLEACMDIDGVLCPDPTVDENDDGIRYREFVSNCRSRHVPSLKVGWLVTSRLEKYRAETEAWLHRQGIRYDHLLMLDLPDKATRIATKAARAFKAEQYRRTGAQLFIESDPDQARFIAAETQNYVICTDTMQMFGPGLLAEQVLRTRYLLNRAFPSQVCRWRNRLARASRRLAAKLSSHLITPSHGIRKC